MSFITISIPPITWLHIIGPPDMGNFLSDLSEELCPVEDSLLNCSQSKLIEYYSSYRSIC